MIGDSEEIEGSRQESRRTWVILDLKVILDTLCISILASLEMLLNSRCLCNLDCFHSSTTLMRCYITLMADTPPFYRNVPTH